MRGNLIGAKYYSYFNIMQYNMSIRCIIAYSHIDFMTLRYLISYEFILLGILIKRKKCKFNKENRNSNRTRLCEKFELFVM